MFEFPRAGQPRVAPIIKSDQRKTRAANKRLCAYSRRRDESSRAARFRPAAHGTETARQSNRSVQKEVLLSAGAALCVFVLQRKCCEFNSRRRRRCRQNKAHQCQVVRMRSAPGRRADAAPRNKWSDSISPVALKLVACARRAEPHNYPAAELSRSVRRRRRRLAFVWRVARRKVLLAAQLERISQCQAGA